MPESSYAHGWLDGNFLPPYQGLGDHPKSQSYLKALRSAALAFAFAFDRDNNLTDA